jgi:hypothetical protein
MKPITMEAVAKERIYTPEAVRCSVARSIPEKRYKSTVRWLFHGKGPELPGGEQYMAILPILRCQ